MKVLIKDELIFVDQDDGYPPSEITQEELEILLGLGFEPVQTQDLAPS